jgi:two-component system cell cycle sensor histidine kinase/response regulator CckA
MKPDVVFGLENAGWPALLVNASGGVLICNAAAKALFGRNLEGQAPDLAGVWAKANGTQPAGFLAWWDKNPANPFDLQLRTADGKERKFPVVIAVAGHEGGKCFLLQLLPLPDAPRPAESSTEFRNSTGDAALRQRLDCALQLARTVSLDFNNALTGVLAHTSLLLSKAEPTHPWRRSLIEVEKSAARAAEIASELALFSRQEKESRRAPTGNLNTLVARCVDAFHVSTGSRLTWRMNQERALYEARYDEGKVQQAITKILENAVESFRPKDDGQVTVATRNMDLTQATQDRNVRLASGIYVCVEVSDNGSGIDDEAMPRVFEPFFTTKGAPHRGLGLALVYGIITNHGGGVAISSQPGRGTSARVYLPAEKTFVNETPPGDKQLHGTGTILVVDDEILLLTMADAILSDFGYRVLTANNGHKALQILAQPETQVDLVITDLVMPSMGGRELMERIRRQGLEMPLMVMSGYVLPEDKQDQATYLQKPFTSTDLLRKVKAAVNHEQ